MAANLVAAGFRVVGYVRDPEQSERLAAAGIEPVTALGALDGCSPVISTVPDDAALTTIVVGPRQSDGLLKHLAPDAIHLSMSTISPQCASDLAGLHARHDRGYVAAPVFGNPDAAKARELFVIAAGLRRHVESCQPVFDAIGQKTFVIGTDPAAANLVKLAGNVMSAATLEILGEVVAFARKTGLDPDQLLSVLTSTMFGSRVHRIYGGKIVAQHYGSPGFALPLALKDVRLALAEAEKAAVPMPSLSVVRDRLLAGIARGYADLDWSALGLIAAEEAGLAEKGAKL
jgi:3-hydroxyisobutyrate dehydrogenase-like beta-hydroxyacid dehydrogenase